LNKTWCSNFFTPSRYIETGSLFGRADEKMMATMLVWLTSSESSHSFKDCCLDIWQAGFILGISSSSASNNLWTESRLWKPW